MIYAKLPCKSDRATCQIFTYTNSSKVSLLQFKYSLKSFVAPLFTYKILLLFNLKCFFFFLCRDLSKPQCCHFILLQPQQSDINKSNCPNLKVIPKGNYSGYFENLWNAVSALYIMKYRDKQLKRQPYYQIFSPVGHYDISGSPVLYQSMKVWKQRSVNNDFGCILIMGHYKLLPANFLSKTGDGDWKQGFVYSLHTICYCN